MPKPKVQKQYEALERLEKKLLDECRKIDNDLQQYLLSNSKTLRLQNTRMMAYLYQANDIRRCLNLKALEVSYYEQVRGNLVIFEGDDIQFYPHL